jgi:hypothetical protein
MLTFTKRRANLSIKKILCLNIQQAITEGLYGLPSADPLQCVKRREKLMKKLAFAILLISSPAWAQAKLAPKGATSRADNCAPIGRTADGKLVYSMKCDNLPAPPPQAETREVPAPAPEPEVQRSGLFGWSYERKRPSE